MSLLQSGGAERDILERTAGYVLHFWESLAQITQLDKLKTEINTAVGKQDQNLMDLVKQANVEVKLFKETIKTCTKIMPPPAKKAKTQVPAA